MSAPTTAADAPPRSRNAFSALRNRQFALFWTAAAISNAGSWMQMIALPVIVFQQTGKATWLGVVSLASLIPSMTLAPMAGALADRVSRRALLVFTQSLMMAASLLLWYLYVVDRLPLGAILAIGFVTGVGGGLNFPIWNAFMPLLVEPDDLVHAVRLNSMQFTAGRVVGPMAAAAVIAASGPATAIFINAATFVFVIAALAAVSPRRQPMATSGETMWRSVLAGGSFMWGHRALRMTVLLAVLNGAFSMSLIQLAPAIAERVFGQGEAGSAQLVVAMGVGALVASLIVVSRGDLWRRSHQVLVGLGAFTVGLAALGATGAFPVGLAVFAAMGFAQQSTAVMCNTVVQLLSPDEMRGRAVAFYMLGPMCGGPIGTLVTGRIADATSMRTALAIDAAAAFVIGLAILARRAHRLLDGDQPARAATR